MLAALQDADAAVIVTEWAEFARPASPAARARYATALLIDGRNLLDPAAVRGGRLRLRGRRAGAEPGRRTA